jgi:peptidoglycan/xylan/chitin deacetylase (PgdA/CDA1 family)
MPTPPYDYWPIVGRPPIEWPGGKRLAFYIALNVEYFEPGRPSTALFPPTSSLPVDPLNHGWRDYGPRVGIWRMIDVLDRHELRASVLLNADVCVHYPQVVEAGRQRNWVWCAHGFNNSSLWTGIEPEQERELLQRLLEQFVAGTGSRPKGWLGPALTETAATPEILAENGLTYVLDWCADDQPFPLNVPGHRLISVPYAIEVNDIMCFLGHGMTAAEFENTMVEQFDVLHDEAQRKPGLVASIALHPFLVNQPFRHRHLDRFLAYVARHDDVWMTTSDDIADWYLERYYDEAVTAISTPSDASFGDE